MAAMGLTPWKKNVHSTRLIGEMEKGGDGFDVEDEYDRFRRRQRIHRMHLSGYAVSAAIILIGMIVFWK